MDQQHTKPVQAAPVNLPPQSTQAEQAVLGGLMLDNSTFHKVESVIVAGDFYYKDHRVIYNAISFLVADNSPLDVITVSEHLDSKDLLESAGGLGYLGALVKDTPSAANVEHYAKIVREKSLLRTIIAVASEMSSEAMSADGSGSQQIIESAENKIFALAQQGLRGKQGFTVIRNVLSSVVDEMEQNFDKPPNDGVLGLSSGFKDLDKMTSGFGAGNLVVIAGRPSMGKTSFAMNIAENISVEKGLVVAVFSMEMQKEELAQRLLSTNSGTPLKNIRESWKIRDHEWPFITESMSRLGSSPLFVDDTPALSISNVRSRIMRLSAEINKEHPGGLAAIVIDYIQLMSSGNNGSDNRNSQIEEITRGLKQLAKELNVPVFALSQLNRNLESRPNKRPVMSDLRDSGSIEQDADIVLFLYRDEVYNPESLEKGVAQVIIGKQRNGALGTVRLQFDAPCTRFRSLDRQGYEGPH